MTFEKLKKYRKYKKILSQSNELSAEQKRAIEVECKEIEDYINSIDDMEVQVIAKKYFLKNITFEEIGKSMNYDRRTISRKLECWLKVAHNAHK